MLEESKIEGVIGQAAGAQERIRGSKCSTGWAGVTPVQGQCQLGCANSADVTSASQGSAVGGHHRGLSRPNLLLRAAPATAGFPGPNPAGFGVSPAISGSSTTYLAKLFWDLITFTVKKFKGALLCSNVSIASHPVHGHCWEGHGFVVLSPIAQVIDENVKQLWHCFQIERGGSRQSAPH